MALSQLVCPRPDVSLSADIYLQAACCLFLFAFPVVHRSIAGSMTFDAAQMVHAITFWGWNVSHGVENHVF